MRRAASAALEVKGGMPGRRRAVFQRPGAVGAADARASRLV
jgi:hypothetical protein